MRRRGVRASFAARMENPAILFDATNWLGRLSVHQDFTWFAALVGWGLAWIVWSRHPQRTAAWRWLPAAAAVGIAGALVQFVVFAPTFDMFQDRLVPGSIGNYRPALVDPYWLGDVLSGALFAGWAAAWASQAALASGRRWALGFIAVVGALLIMLHIGDPARASFLLAAAVLSGAVALAGPTRGHPWARVALIVTALVPICSTVGPLATVSGLLQRHGPPTPVGLLAGAWSALAGGAALMGLLRHIWSRQHPNTHAALRRDLRWAVSVGALWLALGVTVAVKSGADNRREIQQNRLRSTAAQAKIFPSALLAPLADPQFHIVTTTAAAEPIAAYSPWLASGVATDAQRRLAEVVLATPFLEAARIVIVRDGWLAAVLTSEHATTRGQVELLRRATPADLRHWLDRTPHVEPSPVHEIGYEYFCRAPIFGPDGAMLGWLEGVRHEYYLSVERRWRAAPFQVTALGLLLVGLVVVQRQGSREREVARRDALAADEGNRAKSAFLAHVSHELRTPLQNILGYGELLARAGPPEQRATQLAALRGQSELMLRLVNDLIDLSAAEAGVFPLARRPVAVGTLVDETVAGLRPRALAKGLTLTCSIAPAGPEWIETDPDRLQQIVLNLVGNAVKFTPRGSVAVTLAPTAFADGCWRFALHVRDTGPGIAPAEQAKLFRAFSRLERTAHEEGSGLGLALSAALCRALGGDLRVASDGATGSEFIATFVAAATTAPTAEIRGVSETCSPGPRDVLLVEDNTLMRDLFATALQARGVRVRGTADLATARAALATEPPAAAVIDLTLGTEDGSALLPEFRTRAPRCRLVVVSALTSPADRERALAAGADAFLAKPVALDALWRALGGGDGPAAATLPDYFAGDPTARRAVCAQFHREWPAWSAAITAALAARDFAAVRARAHHLRSSALAVGATDLLAAAGALEEAATRADGPGADAAWRACDSAVRTVPNGG